MTTMDVSPRIAFRQKVRQFRRSAREVYAPLTAGWEETKTAVGARTSQLRASLAAAPPLVKLLVYAVPVVLILALPQLPFVSAFYKTVLVDRVAFYVLLALGLNVVVGFAGLLDLGYVAFYAIGAYTAAFFTGAGPVQPPFTLDPFLTFPFAILVAMLAGVALGLPTLRLRGDYLAIVTLGFHEIVRLTLKNSDPFTNGDRGISAIPHPALPAAQAEPGTYLVALLVLGALLAVLGAIVAWRYPAGGGRGLGLAFVVGGVVLAALAPVINEPAASFGQRFADFGLDPIPYYYLSIVIIGVMIFIIRRLEDSRIGRAWVAIREDEIAAEAMGVPTLKMKVWAFAIGASTAGFAGVMLAVKTSFINPQYFILLQSIIVLSMVVFGGMGSIWGAIAGAIFIGFITEALRDFDAVPFTPAFRGFGVVIALLGLLVAVNVIRTRTGRPYGLWLLGIGLVLVALAGPLGIPFREIAENPENWRLFILGLILTAVMILRPEGLIPSRRRAAELHGEATAEQLHGADAAEAEADEQASGKVQT
jgi:branched-chain amino acid transport system permease protein